MSMWRCERCNINYGALSSFAGFDVPGPHCLRCQLPLTEDCDVARVAWVANTVADQLQDANIRIHHLELALSKARAALPDSDTPTAETDVDRAIDQLGKRMVPAPDRQRLRGAIDKADAPLGGREGANEAVGKAIGRRE